MKHFLPLVLPCLLLTACNDDMYVQPEAAVGHIVKFDARIVDDVKSRGDVVDVSDNRITDDFKAGDAFGLFIVDADDNFVTLIDGKPAKNLKLTTPDGVAWNLQSDITEIVHKPGYKYVAYFPYSEDFNDCSSEADIQAKLTAPSVDQSTTAATDWLFTRPTTPQTNAVTTLCFQHRYAKIDVYNSYTQEHHADWLTDFRFTKTTDENGVEHYRYILDTATPQKWNVGGTYTIGNYLTGMKELSYNAADVLLQNGHHAIVYTYGMDERCAVDLGFPSGVKWSPINLGAETDTHMDEAEIAAATGRLGRRLAWGELFEKDVYSYATYINDNYVENGTSLLPADISETVYDAARQYWGGHWTLPSTDDMKEFIANTEIVGTETFVSEELGTTATKTTFRSLINNREITLVSGGYGNGSIISYPAAFYYLSAGRRSAAYFTTLNDRNALGTYDFYRWAGCNIRPVLKQKYTFTLAEKSDIVKRHIDELGVDLGITKTVNETVDGVTTPVTYKLIWSPFNFGAEAKVDVSAINNQSVADEELLDKCMSSPGIRLCWGDLAEPAGFYYSTYIGSAIHNKYPIVNSAAELDVRHLQPEDDIVQANWPDGWHIPTAEDLRLLYTYTSFSTQTVDGRNWIKLTGKTAGYEDKSILIPPTEYIDNSANNPKWGTAAYLHSATVGARGNTSYAPYTEYVLKLTSSGGSLLNTAGRPTGFMLRPVKYVRVE
ncbi:MAG: fimbrillin family protein [Alloprevotella sp.]